MQIPAAQPVSVRAGLQIGMEGKSPALLPSFACFWRPDDALVCCSLLKAGRLSPAKECIFSLIKLLLASKIRKKVNRNPECPIQNRQSSMILLLEISYGRIITGITVPTQNKITLDEKKIVILNNLQILRI